MKLPVRFRHLAKVEYDEAFDWYDDARAGLGEEFEAEVEKTIDEAASHPSRFPVVEGDIREAPVSRFPYCVYYRVSSNRLNVLAVYHQSRDPAGWRGRS